MYFFGKFYFCVLYLFYYLCYYEFRQGYNRAYIIKVRNSSTMRNIEESNEKICSVSIY